MTAKTPQKIVDRAIEHYGQSKSAVKSARKFGIATSVMYRALAARGIKRDGDNKKLPDDQVVIDRYLAGEKPEQIGADYGVTWNAVIGVLRKTGTPRRPRGGTPIALSAEQRKRLTDLYMAGQSLEQISLFLKYTPKTLRALLRRYGVHRPRSARRETHGLWRGGRSLRADGYWLVLVDAQDPLIEMSSSHGYVLEHRLVMARSLGRVLDAHETVHHINGDRSDNRIENLQLRKGKHGKGSAMICLDCGSHNVSHAKLG